MVYLKIKINGSDHMSTGKATLLYFLVSFAKLLKIWPLDTQIL